MQPLDWQRELERADVGGRPEDLSRSLMLAGLAQMYERLFDCEPTGSRSARADCFVNFCQQVLETCGMEINGLEQAIDRFLTTRKRPRATRRPRGKAEPKPA